MQFPSTQYTMSGDVSIAYQIWGNGPVDIVMVPVMVNHLEHLLELDDYVKFMNRLSSFARVITFDKRGQGMSDYPGVQNSLENRVDDIRAVMDAAKCDKAVIFGSSEGGPMSIMFSVTHPERVKALILYGSFAKFVKSEDYPYPFFDKATLVGMAPLCLKQWGCGVFSNTLAPSFSANPEKMQWLAKLERLSNTPAGIIAIMGMNAEIDIQSLLSVVNVPTLVLHKTNDSAFPISCGHHLHEHISGSKFLELQGTDHLPYAGDTKTLVDEIEDFITGQRGTQFRADRILATVLFTDIVDSSKQATELGDQKWKELLDLHDKISKEQVEAHRGKFIKSTGDGMLAIFDGPGRAIQCTLKTNHLLQLAGIVIRSGLHTGEIEIRGQDIGGISVHIASRIESKALAGEILVSRTLTDLVAGSGITFEDRGMHQLKGISGDWRLFKVICEPQIKSPN